MYDKLDKFYTKQKLKLDDIDLFEPNKSMRMMICLCIDVSSVMYGYREELKEDIKTLMNDICEDEFLNSCVELGVYTYASDTKKIRDIRTIKNLESAKLTIVFDEKCSFPNLSLCLKQCMVDIECRLGDYRVKSLNCYHPHIIILGAGEPTVDDDWKKIIDQVHNKQEKEEVSIIPIVLGENAIELYSETSNIRRVYRGSINDLKYIFKTLKNSMNMLSNSSANDYKKLYNMVSDWNKYLVTDNENKHKK